ncbi:Gfo/Idh/MocA family protein [Vibrio casei]|uniref:Gfo/Idh/MocA family oxidoreductase n=1 Tax=Vibrio casei TaxID=673372 RepID=A0A368LH74_9VIBR|nr:Gfo/Idh/MocA family oxidoreductase [Vibrio casei]RCS69975.1 gfo/Idh/MocA family oxidoreductase [Vibrio casei]SJN31231.1 Myo-inositol 2-dehydrogenase 1 [Vibrio casei]
MTNRKKVLVFGTGFAGQGHTKAFRDAGAEVVGIVGRNPNVVKEVAKKLDIPYFGSDWAKALEQCQPDIVSIATPGGAHVEPITQAINAGCHVFCDKPLSESGNSATTLYQLALEKRVKTAFASSFCYMPHIIQAKQMVAKGLIGEPLEVECISHFNLDKHIPFGWSHRIENGGGRLNNNFTHLVSIVTSVIGENILSFHGEVRNDMPKAPVVQGVHNFMERRNFIPKDLNDPSLEWKDCDVEWSYTVLMQLESRTPAKQPVSVLFKHGGLVPRFNEDHIVFHGSKGSIYIKGNYGGGPLYLLDQEGDKQWKEVALPEEINQLLPNIEDDTQRSWTHLAIQLVKDVSCESVEPYQTFKEGSEYQEIIDIIRNGNK